MLKMIKAAWNVLMNNDIQKPIKVKKRTKKEVEDFRVQLEKEKAMATARQEPWVKILNMDVDYNDLSNGNFELDWNDLFVARLARFGYQGKTDSDLVEQWFTDICRNIVLETYEQGAADLHPVKSVKLDNGRREYK